MAKKSQLSQTDDAQSSRFFKRERLFRKLDSARKKPIIWISGPAGSGKTTLLSGYIESRKLRSFRGLNDLSEGPSVYSGIPDKNSIAGPYLLIFDNYHNVPYSSDLHRSLKADLSNIPKGVNVIFLSRHEPHPVLLAEVVSNGTLIGWDELRLNYDETKEFLSAGDRFGDDDILRLYRKTDGWIMGLVAHIEHNEGKEYSSCNEDIFCPDEIADAFAGMFAKLDCSFREFLLKTAVFRTMSAAMAERLSRNPHAEQILSGLCRRSFFIEKVDSGYCCQPLFREFLLQRARKEFSDGEWTEISHSAARILSAAGREGEAGDVLIGHGLWDALAGFIIDAAPAMAAKGRLEAVSEWTAALPEDYFSADPRLLYWKGLSEADNGGVKFLEEALKLCSALKDKEAMLLSFLALSDMYISSSEFSRAEGLISFVETGMRNDPSFSVSGSFGDAVMNLFVLMSVNRPDHPDISFWEDRAFVSVLAGHNADINRRLSAGVNLCRYYLWIGDFSKAAFIRGFLIDHIRMDGVSSKVLGLFDELEAFYDLFVGPTSAIIIKSLGLLQGPEEKGRIGLLMHGLAASIEEDDALSFDRIYQHLSSLLNSAKESELAYYHYLLACRGQINGDHDKAFYNQSLALNLLAKSGRRLEEPLFFIKMAEIQYERGVFSDADHFRLSAREAACRMNSSFFEHLCALLDQHVLFDRGAGYEVNDCLNKAMLSVRAQKLLGLIWTNHAFMTRICMKALQSGIEKDTALEVIRKRRLMPDTPPLDVEEWPYPVMIYALGRFAVIKDSLTLKGAVKLQSKPIAMIKALIAFGGVDVSKAQIIDALWPEADGDSAVTSFESTLHRLRRLIEDYKGIQLCDGQLSLDPRYYWVDAWAFEHMVGKADASWQSSRSAGHKNHDALNAALGLSEKTINLYKGAFLPADSDSAWTISKRESLRNMFVSSASKPGEYWISEGKWKTAADWFRRCIDIDGSAEVFYRRLISCYKNLGLNIEADKLYGRMQAVLSGKV
ncbi:MAG: hypothetical protein EPN22_11630 [Nitrospirae bacterium]|nr:MAG: hypothetical protein EPN22_11630 [Nitrospirota bacterium]